MNYNLFSKMIAIIGYHRITPSSIEEALELVATELDLESIYLLDFEKLHKAYGSRNHLGNRSWENHLRMLQDQLSSQDLTKEWQGDSEYYFSIMINAQTLLLCVRPETRFFLIAEEILVLKKSFEILIRRLKEATEGLHLDELFHMFEGMEGYIAAKDSKGKILYANSKAIELFKSKYDHIVGRTIDELYPVEEVEKIRSMDQQVLEGCSVFTSGVEMYTDHGMIIVNTNRFAIRNFLNEVIAFVSISYDVSEEIQAKAKLEHTVALQNLLVTFSTRFINVSEDKANQVIQESLAMSGELIHADRIYVFDYDYETRSMNNIYEWCAEDISPQIDELQGVPMDEFLEVWVYPHQRGETVYFEDVLALSKESSLYQILVMQDIKSVLTIPLIHEKVCYGFVGFDAVKSKAQWSEDDLKLLKVLAEMIINLKIKQKYQHELEIARAKAEAANVAKSDFLANMSHEIRTPLSGIYNSLYLLVNTELSSEQQEYVEIAKTSIEAISGIVNNILDLSRIEAGKLDLDPSPFLIEDELFQVIKTQEYSAHEKGIEIRMNHDYSIPATVIFDRLRLRQILLNLMHNAIKYTDKGYVMLQSKLIDVSENDVAIEFIVQDTGIGIEESKIPLITEKFFQASNTFNRSHTGSGLGLAIVKQLIDLFRGKLLITSRVGEGSIFRFTLTFPIAQRHTTHRFQAVFDKRVLLVFESDHHIQFVSDFLISMGFQTDAIQSTSQQQYDYIIFHEPYVHLKPELVDEIKTKFGHPHVKTILCYSSTIAQHQVIDEMNHFDLTLSMPNTRERFYQSLLGLESNQEKVSSIKTDWIIERQFTGFHVLVVDDNRINRQSLEMILKRAGFLVSLAASGLDALDLVRTTPFDLILMDIQMPGMDGYETTQAIRRLESMNQDTPIVAVTANALVGSKERAIESGMNDSISKPIKTETMFHLFQKIMSTCPRVQKVQNHEDNFNLPPENLKSFHYEDFVSRFDGMKDVEQLIITTFLEDYQKDYQKIVQTVKSKNYKEIAKAAHYMKGSTAYVSAEKAAWILQKLIQIAEEQNINLIDKYLTLLQEELHKWRSSIEKYYRLLFE